MSHRISFERAYCVERYRRFRAAVIVVAAAALSIGCQRSDDVWTPNIPVVWDDAAIATIEIPPPDPRYAPRHIDSDYYYAIAPRTIYKSYPIYHPDREPEGYWEWLHEQEPQVAFDVSKLATEDDWRRAGELVFTEGVNYQTDTELAFVRDPDAYAAAGIRLTAEGHFPYARYFVREKGKVEIGVDACSVCHSRVLADGTLVYGAQGDFPLGKTSAYEIARLEERPTGVPIIDTSSSDYRDYAAPWLDPDPGAHVLGQSLDQLAEVLAALPPGVVARERSSYLAPTRIPDLIGVQDRLYLDATGLVQHRSVGDLMRYAALNQGADDLSSFGGFVPFAEDGKTRPPPTDPRLSRYTDEQLYALALFVYSLQPPPNPNPFDAAARRGADVFEKEGCGRCHSPPLYTNNRLTPADGFEPPRSHDAAYRLSDRRVGTDPTLTMGTRRGTGYYKVPSLKGVWYRGPFFHDGAVATLEDVFDPARLDDDYAPTAFRGAGVEHRAVPGHRFGLALRAAERTDLIAFLKTL